MSRIRFVIDSSDKTVEESKEYLKEYIFYSWLTGEPEFISGYSIATKGGREVLWFRDKKEIRKFTNFLLKQIKKSVKQVQRETK